MTAALNTLYTRLTRIDGLLLVAALVGASLYVVLLPVEHPDAAASYALGDDTARQAAGVFLSESGYALNGYETTSGLIRDTDLLNALQTHLGRRAARRLLENEGANVPAYHWRVRYEVAEEDDAIATSHYTLGLTVKGEVLSFDRRLRGLQPGRRVDHTAFRAVVAGSVAVPGGEVVAPDVDFSMLADSLFVTSFAFNPTDSLWRRDPAQMQPFSGEKVLDVLTRYQQEPGGTFNATLAPAYAVALARYHLGRTVWDPDVFRPDSIWLLPQHDNRLANVRMLRAEPLYGRQVRTDVVVSATGALLKLDVAFERSPHTPSPGAAAGEAGVTFREEQTGDGETLRTVASVAQAILYGMIGLVFVVVFFKRLVARLIDGKAVFLDFAVIGVVMALSMGLNKEAEFSNGIESLWLQVLVRVMGSMFVGVFVGLFALILSGTIDSVARSVWPKKLHVASLVRLGEVRNVFVGAALLRGAGLAMVLLGLIAGFLFLFPNAGLHFEETESTRFLEALTWQLMVWQVVLSGVYGYLVVMMGLLGVATFVYRIRPKAWLVVGAVVVAMAVLQVSVIDFEPVVYTWMISALWGLVLGLALWHYDLVTCFIGLFVAHLIWGLGEGWLVEASPAELDVWLGGVFVVGLLALGVRGVVSGQTRSAATEYVPAYITEMKQQERLKGELDVAREVQESFLPRRMPEVPGLDIAAMCLAAYEVGGDYYDFVKLGPGKLAVVVGDVSGKGTQAAFYMTLTKGFVQTLSREDLGPAEVMRRLNMLFCENVTRGTFISMIYGVFDVAARTFTFARAGHNPVILKRSPSQEPDLVQPTGLAIGLVTGATFDDTIEERTINLRLGDVLVFYTDGFSEAMNAAKDQYGDDRLARKVSDLGQRSAMEILHAVAEDVHHFVEAAGRHDDMTMVVVKLDQGRAHSIPAAAHKHAVAEV